MLYDIHRHRISYSLQALDDAAKEKDPVFLISHIYAPHPPFVFDELGNHIHPDRPYNKFDADGYRSRGGTQKEYIDGYSGQLNYLFKEMILVIDHILTESDSQPILIIQGDHGPGSMVSQYSIEDSNLDERFSIMNAYYFPDQDYSALYPEITPVNSFRIIFNQFFNMQLELLPDRNYFSTVSQPYQFTDVTEMLE
jgi:hypothetical protein